MDRLDVRRPKNRIVEKLLVMGLVQDKKELRKKRARKSDMPGSRSGQCEFITFHFHLSLLAAVSVGRLNRYKVILLLFRASALFVLGSAMRFLKLGFTLDGIIRGFSR